MLNSFWAARWRVRAMSFIGVSLLALLMPPAANVLAQSPPDGEADLLIANGKVIDGSGSPWRQANVAIKGDTIVYVGNAPVKAKKTVNAAGQAVTPGFIDMHAHSEFGLSLDGRGLSMVTQGVTTEVLGEHQDLRRHGARAGGGRSHDDHAAGETDLDDFGRLLRHPDQKGYRAQCRLLCRSGPGSRLGDGL
jgi:predicted amidohydrolase